MAAQEERTSSLIPTRDALALEAAELRKFTPTKPLAEITEEIKTEVAARRQKEGEVKRVKEKITTINARVRQLASQKRAPLPAEMQKAAKNLGSVEITAQQSALLTKQVAESAARSRAGSPRDGPAAQKMQCLRLTLHVFSTLWYSLYDPPVSGIR